MIVVLSTVLRYLYSNTPGFLVLLLYFVVVLFYNLQYMCLPNLQLRSLHHDFYMHKDFERTSPNHDLLCCDSCVFGNTV